jgi:hypothetical protein
MPNHQTTGDNGAARGQWTWQFWTTIGLVIAFAVLIAVMFAYADGSETLWQRRIYLFSALEAIVFTAVGWLFGREVHRSAAETARQDAANAKQEAHDAKTETLSEIREAEAAKRQAAVEQIKGKVVRSAVRSAVSVAAESGMRDVHASGQNDPQLRALSALLDELYD